MCWRTSSMVLTDEKLGASVPDTPNPDQAGNSADAQTLPPQAPVQPAPTGSTNTLAIVALVGSFFIGLVGIICGHIALKQIKRTGESGRGLALAGTIIGYVTTAIAVIGVIFWIVMASLIVGSAQSSITELEQQIDALPDTLEVPSTPDSSVDDGTTDAAGERSAEFCEIFAQATEASATTDDSGNPTPEALELFKRLAETPSPNQEIYQRFSVIAQDPQQLQNDVDPEALMTDYFEAAMEDGMACM